MIPFENRTPRQLYRKLFYTYTVVAILLSVGFVGYFLSTVRTRNLKENLNEAQRLSLLASEYMMDAQHITDYLHGNLYQAQDVMQDLENYLIYDSEGYLSRRLDNYTVSNYLQANSIFSYIEGAFSAYGDLKRVEIVSYEKEEITYCFANNQIFPAKKGQERLNQIMKKNAWTENEFYFQKEIKNMTTGETLGCVLTVFDTKYLDKIRKEAGNSKLLVIDGKGNKISGNAVYDKIGFLTAQADKTLEKYTKSYVIPQNVENYKLYVLLDKKAAARIGWLTLTAVFGTGIVLILGGEFLIRFYLQRLNGRLNLILKGMEQVRQGDLSARLASTANGDELDLIAANFNEMCRELDRYIQKSYLAEIEQKNAEMQVLQNQINPHFLYNTLEAIRMKAITNGDREVGKMLYSMAVTFRAQLKEKDVITVGQELHYCKKYMEIFEYRYQGRFSCSVDCPLELMPCPIIKFVLQPLIENYFVHGIRMEANDNYIAIYVERREERLRIHLKDNGKGMEPSELKRQNEMLEKNKYEQHASIGLSNVNRRVTAVYGQEYGVRLSVNPTGGLHVTLDIKYEEGELA